VVESLPKKHKNLSSTTQYLPKKASKQASKQINTKTKENKGKTGEFSIYYKILMWF
jgi:hypothetical protein